MVTLAAPIFLQRIKEWVKVGNSVPHNDLPTLERHAQVVKQRLQLQATTLIKESAGQPVLWTFFSDATPMRLRRTISAKELGIEAQKGSEPLIRNQKQGYDYLSQRGFVKTILPDGSFKTAAVPVDHRPLSNGKKTGFLYAAAKEVCPPLPQMHRTGISISVFCFDRAVFSSLGGLLMKRACQWHHKQLLAAVESDNLLEAQDRLLRSRLLDWSIVLACANHDCHNALRWAVGDLLPDLKQGLKDFYISIESLRNSYGTLMKAVPQFLDECLVFTDRRANEDPEEINRYWISLGVESSWLETMVDLNPFWNPSTGKLEVSSSVSSDPHVKKRIAAVILYLFKFRSTNGARWCTIAPSSRTLTAALSMGLEGLVQCVKKSPKYTEFYLGGFDSLDTVLKRFVLVCGYAGFVPDSVLNLLLADDRVLRQLVEIKACMEDELNFLDSLPPMVWERLESLATPPNEEDTDFDIKTAVMHAGLLGQAFIKRRVLDRADAAPFHLTQNDIEKNVQDLLKQRQAPEELITRKIWTLLRSGMIFSLSPATPFPLHPMSHVPIVIGNK